MNKINQLIIAQKRVCIYCTVLDAYLLKSIQNKAFLFKQIRVVLINSMQNVYNATPFEITTQQTKR